MGYITAPHFSRLLRHAWGYGGHILDLSPRVPTGVLTSCVHLVRRVSVVSPLCGHSVSSCALHLSFVWPSVISGIISTWWQYDIHAELGKVIDIARPPQSHRVATMWHFVTLKLYRDSITESAKTAEIEKLKDCLQYNLNLQWAASEQQNRLMSVWQYQKKKKRKTKDLTDFFCRFPVSVYPLLLEASWERNWLSWTSKATFPDFPYFLFLFIMNIGSSLCEKNIICLRWHFRYELNLI